MHVLDTITITFAGLMVGNELALSAFVNPAVWQLESGPQAQGLSVLARSLGRVMPVWYALGLASLALESFLHRHQAALVPLLTATLIWATVIVFSISMLVPINNRICFFEHSGADPQLEGRSQKMGLVPSHPHSASGGSPLCPHLRIGCLSSATYRQRKPTRTWSATRNLRCNSGVDAQKRLVYATHSGNSSARLG